MSHFTRRSLLLKAFAFVTLIAVSGLVAQEFNECEDNCHVQGSNIYNDMKAEGHSEEDALAMGAAHKAVCVFASCG